MDEIWLSDVSVLNIEKEFSENLNLNFKSVVNTFAKIKNRRIVSLLGLCIMHVQLSIAIFLYK